MSGALELKALPRAEGNLRLGIRRRDQHSVLHRLYQQGSAKIRFPRVDPGEPLQAVTLNTAGGLTDGDRFTQTIDWGPETQALITTQAAERIYRSRAGDAHVENHLRVAENARAVWLPQETILFDGARLDRTATIDLSAGASLFAAETWTLGRTAMGERVHSGALHDAWEIRRDGNLLWTDRFHMDSRRDGDLDAWVGRRAVLDGRIAMLTAVLVADANEDLCPPVREALECKNVLAGCSQIEDVLLVRALGSDARDLRFALIRLFDALKSASIANNPLRDCRIPRVFDC